MSLWRDRTTLQELLSGVPRVVMGNLDDEGSDERTLVLFIDEAVEAVEESEGDHTLEIVLGSLAALIVLFLFSGSVLYVGLARMFPAQTRRLEAAALTAASTVIQV